MKQFSFVFFMLFCTLLVSAQDKIPAFGSIDKADLQMKDCEFDPGAEAVVLLDVGEVQYAYIMDVGWVLEAEYRIRIKILKQSGMSYANHKIRFFNDESTEDLTQLSGITYNLDEAGNIVETKLERKEKYKKNIDDEKGEASFAMPAVKVGSVIEYRYKISVSAFGYIPAWRFQWMIPVKYSAYRVVLPSNFQYTVQTISRQPLEKKNMRSAGYWYIMRNIPGLKTEPLSSGKNNYLQRIEFQLSKIDVPGYYYENTWRKIIERLAESKSFGLLLKKRTRYDDEVAVQLEGATSDKQKIQTIYNYVQANMQWNGDYALTPQSSFDLKDAWDKRTGSIADINFMLLKLLQKAGINAKPLLVSTKDNGIININYPFINQFNAVMAYVKDGEQRYVMNAADKNNPFDLIPCQVAYTNALVVDKETGGLVGLNNNKKFQKDIFSTIYIEGDGKLTGTATLTSYNYARNEQMDTYKNGKPEEVLEVNQGIKIKVDSVKLKNEKDELKPLVQEIQFSGNMETGGGYYFLPFGIFSGLEKNPFTEEDRLTDIDFQYPKKYVISGSYVLTDDFIVDDLPKNKRMMMPDSSIEMTRMIQKENNTISFRLTLDLNSAVYAADDYPLIKEFFNKMYAILEERIVLKKK